MVSELSNKDKSGIIRKVIINRQELKHKQERLQYNIYAGVCQKSIP